MPLTCEELSSPHYNPRARGGGPARVCGGPARVCGKPAKWHIAPGGTHVCGTHVLWYKAHHGYVITQIEKE